MSDQVIKGQWYHPGGRSTRARSRRALSLRTRVIERRLRSWPAMVTLALTVAATFGLSSCFLADPGITLRNDTERNLWIDDDPANDQSLRYKVEPGDLSSLSTDECTNRPVEAQTRSGRVIGVLDQTWCPGQPWYINGEGEFVLKDST